MDDNTTKFMEAIDKRYQGNPEIEDGFTRIANELLEAVTKAISSGIIVGQESAIVLWIIRYTYGFHQTNGFFHTSYIAKELGLPKSWVSQLLSRLQKKNIIIKNGNQISLNKHYKEWKSLVTTKQNNEDDSLVTTKQRLVTTKQDLVTTKQQEPTKQEQILSEETPKENCTKKTVLKKTSIEGNKKQRISFNENTLQFVGITDEKIKKWQDSFNCDVVSELKKMECWLAADPRRRKKNYEKFIVGWLSRAIKTKEGSDKNGRYIPANYQREGEEIKVSLH